MTQIMAIKEPGARARVGVYEPLIAIFSLL